MGIYSDYFSSYNENDFNNMKYLLHLANHSVWFGKDKFQTKKIEGL